MATKKKNQKDEDEGPPRAVVKRYSERLTVLRQAQDYSQKDDIPKAVQYYNRYLSYLAAYFQIDVDDLHPKYFQKENNLAEVLLISQVYWDLSKAYDRNPRLHRESEKCLQMFLKFSIGFKFQFINSEMLRKFLKKGLAYNPKAFENAYEKIAVRSKKCYIATFCYGEGHNNLFILRTFKSKLVRYKLGIKFVNLYYRFSPKLIYCFEKNPKFAQFLNSYVIRPTLNSISTAIKYFNN